MSEKVQKIVEQLKELTLIEAAELVKAIEETFGVSAAAPVAVAASPSAAAPAGGAQEEAKTEFDVVLESVPADKKIAVIKVVKTLTNTGLAEAKAIVEGAPKTILTGAKKEDAEKAKNELIAAGATVTLK